MRLNLTDSKYSDKKIIKRPTRGICKFLFSLYRILEVANKDEEEKRALIWVDDGMAFIINNTEKLKESLASHFRTYKIKSFVRQLYMYKFKCIVEDKVKKYYNPEFNRGAYHKLTNIKPTINKGTLDESNELRIAYEVLQHKFNILYKSAMNLRNQITQAVKTNKEELHSILYYQSKFIERIKAVLFNFTLTSIFFNSSTISREVSLMEQFGYISKNAKDSFNSSKKIIKITPKQIRRYVTENFTLSGSYDSFISKLLENSIYSLNDEFFKLPKGRFYVMVLKYVINDEVVPELTQHNNYKHLSDIKKMYETICSNTLKHLISSNLLELIKEQSRQQKIEYLPTNNKAIEELPELDDSTHSLSSMLLLSIHDDHIDIMKPHFDD